MNILDYNKKKKVLWGPQAVVETVDEYNLLSYKFIHIQV